MRCVWFLLQNSRLDNTPILAKPLLLHRKRNSKSGTPQTSTGSASKEGEFKFPEPLPPNRDSQWKPVRDVAETRSLSPEDAAQQLRNLKMDSISEGRRIGGPGPPTVLEVKSSVGVRWTYLLSLSPDCYLVPVVNSLSTSLHSASLTTTTVPLCPTIKSRRLDWWKVMITTIVLYYHIVAHLLYEWISCWFGCA